MNADVARLSSVWTDSRGRCPIDRLNWAVAYCRVSSNSLQGSFEIENRRFFYHSECFILKKKCCSFARSDSVTCCFSQKKMSKR